MPSTTWWKADVLKKKAEKRNQDIERQQQSARAQLYQVRHPRAKEHKTPKEES